MEATGKEMTHDELMKGLKALLAVVELHKPIISSEYGTECEHCELCGVCAPCPTIQAIEKELRIG